MVFWGRRGVFQSRRRLLAAASMGASVTDPGAFIFALSPAAWYRYGLGITSFGGAVSQWSDASGNARNLTQASGAAQPTLQGDNTILFNGTSQSLRTSAFTLNQPETVYLLFKQVSWSDFDTILDGSAGDTLRLQQTTVSPTINQSAGTGQNSNADLAIGTYGVFTAVFNSTNSYTRVNKNTAVGPGFPNNGNAGGITLGCYGDGSSVPANIQVKELIVFPVAHDTTTQNTIIDYLNSL